MKLRAPSYPLITIDPYFSIWCDRERLYDDDIKTWDSRICLLIGNAEIDGQKYTFMGSAKGQQAPAMNQTEVIVSSFSTKYVFEAAGVRLTADFFTPVLPTDADISSRPASYLRVNVETVDGESHSVKISVLASEDFCVEKKLQNCVLAEKAEIGDGISAMKMGGIEQLVLGHSGDNRGIDWGYFYLAVNNGTVSTCDMADRLFLNSESLLNTESDTEAIIVFAYDDIYSIKYFGEFLKAYWKRNGKTCETVISEAFSRYDELKERCDEFDKRLKMDAENSGGEKYAELLSLSLRQIMAACKLVVKDDGEMLCITKECFSNGCAATVDISYPTLPVFLLYNPKIAEAMIKPIFEYSVSGKWPFEFAPHDLGTYPILNGQVYSRGINPKKQMPVEECGNMLIMTAAVTKTLGNTELLVKYRDLLEQWAQYLCKFGADPDNQLCTDDFAGHLAHNCNLSLKTVFALAAYSWGCEKAGDTEKSVLYRDTAVAMAEKWKTEAANGDGTYRLTFDAPNTYSMKYNAVWDKVFELNIFPKDMWDKEIEGYIKHMNPYGLPLDSRSDWTKSDWMLWTATLADDEEFFKKTADALWLNYNLTPSRVPMCDLYSSVTSLQVHFQHRSVQGGLFIKILLDKGICSLKD